MGTTQHLESLSRVEETFRDFLWSEQAQKIFVEYGYRSVDEPLNAGNPGFGTIPDLFSIADFGGWTKAKKDIVDGIWKKQVLKNLKK